jgi:hypothetical protein
LNKITTTSWIKSLWLLEITTCWIIFNKYFYSGNHDLITSWGHWIISLWLFNQDHQNSWTKSLSLLNKYSLGLLITWARPRKTFKSRSIEFLRKMMREIMIVQSDFLNITQNTWINSNLKKCYLHDHLGVRLRSSCKMVNDL